MKKTTKPGDLIPSQKKKLVTDPKQFERMFRMMDGAKAKPNG